MNSTSESKRGSAFLQGTYAEPINIKKNEKLSHWYVPLRNVQAEPVFLNVYGAPESIPRNESPPAYVAWRAGTITLFLIGS